MYIVTYVLFSFLSWSQLCCICEFISFSLLACILLPAAVFFILLYLRPGVWNMKTSNNYLYTCKCVRSPWLLNLLRCLMRERCSVQTPVSLSLAYLLTHVLQAHAQKSLSVASLSQLYLTYRCRQPFVHRLLFQTV